MRNMRVCNMQLEHDPSSPVRAYFDLIYYDMRIEGLRLIESKDHYYFVAMPDRKRTDNCPSCNKKNPLDARHCNNCGVRLEDHRVPLDERGRSDLFVDVAHPVTAQLRNALEEAAIDAYGLTVEQMQHQALELTALRSTDADKAHLQIAMIDVRHP